MPGIQHCSRKYILIRFKIDPALLKLLVIITTLLCLLDLIFAISALFYQN